MRLCPRHQRLLEDAIDLRGLDQPVDPFDACGFAAQAILTHATHFAGAAAVELLTGRTTNHGRPWCLLCFVNQNPARVNCDGWVEDAADEALAEAIRRRDTPAPLVT